MKKLISAVVLAIFSLLPLAAQQGTNIYVRSLAANGSNITFDLQTARSVNGYIAPQKVMGYRVCVFSDNSQTARGAAAGVMGVISTVAPDVRGNMVYTNPFFRVYAGHCINKTEATMLLGRLRHAFPKAFIATYYLDLDQVNAEVDPLSSPAQEGEQPVAVQ